MIDPKVKVSTEKPPNWDTLEKTFGVVWGHTAVAYGDTLHISSEPSEDLLQHEMVHLVQQKFSRTEAKKWWDKYIKDAKFRMSQEIPAYQRQYGTLKLLIADRNQLALHRARLARDLSGPMYGSVMRFSDALKLINV